MDAKSAHYSGYCPETEQDETIYIVRKEVPILGQPTFGIKWLYECPYAAEHKCSIQTNDYMSCPLFIEGKKVL